MSSPVPTEPDRGNVSATAGGGNRLALTSFLLSLVPPVAWVLFYAIAVLVQQQYPNRGPSANGVTPQDSIRYVFALLAYVVGLIAGIASIAVGVQAVRRAREVPPQQARTGIAIAGLVIGSAGTALVLCPGTLIVYIQYLCTTGPCS